MDAKTPLVPLIQSQTNVTAEVKAAAPNLAADTSPIKYSWCIPLMVVFVTGATIYLSVLNNQIEYVYSLATACFGYYFGQFTARYARPPKE